MSQELRPGLTVLGNLSIDLIDDAPPSPGGCASFAGAALEAAGGYGRIVAMAAADDLGLFAALTARFGPMVSLIASDRTSSFGLRYEDEKRTLTVEAVGQVWSQHEVDAADPDTTWVHVAPLLRADFPAHTLALLAQRGHRISYDGQGLVRSDRLGPVGLDRDFEPALLENIAVLKIADDEALVIAEGDFDESTARSLGIAEIIVTFGSDGCDLYLDGAKTHIPAAWRVKGVHTTGAGDMFTTCYVASRAAGVAPAQAAERASQLVARELQRRLETIQERKFNEDNDIRR